MTTTANFENLSERIEQVVQDHIAASLSAAEAALGRAFAAAVKAPTGRSRSSRSRRVGPRRASAEMAAVGERLYEAVCAKPGQTMTVLAGDVGVTVRELQRPMAHLKRGDRVRSVGQRSLCRYFPMVSEATEPA